MVKYFVEEEKEKDGEKHWEKKSEHLTKSAAKLANNKEKERVHECFHDEENPQPCRIV